MNDNVCTLCPRNCKVDRKKATGVCNAPESYKIARAGLHFWEEPCISGKSGSGTVFFSGCSLKCVYCQNYILSHECYGKEISEKTLLNVFDKLVESGANNINLVNPTHYSDILSGTLKKFNSPIPVVYNTGGYDKVEALKKLEGLIDIYLPDIKYFDSGISKKYSKAEDYFSVACEAVKEMKRQLPQDKFDENMLMKKGTIIRHMILPGNISQSIKILDYIADSFGTEAYVSLMSQYTPFGEAKNYPVINRRISKSEYKRVKDHLFSLGFENVYLQELSSAKEEYIPDFNIDKSPIKF